MCPGVATRGESTGPVSMSSGGRQRTCRAALWMTRAASSRSPWATPCTTRDGIVEALAAWWAAWDAREQGAMARLQITMDNGPESRGRRTPCLHRMVACGASLGKPLPLLSSPPAHRKENPIDRWWGILAGHWNGTTLVNVETMVAWAKRMTWQGMPPMVALRRKVSHKGGGTLSKRAMRAVEARLERHPALPYWDMLIRPTSTS
jgi:hypothetical protein